LSNLGVLVTEAGEKSGSLITARLARKMNRKVWAVPGPITSSVSAGTNWLIAEGLAKLVTRPEEILERKTNATQTGLPIGADKIEQKIIEKLMEEAAEADQMAKVLNISPTELLTKLSMLELRGVVRQEDGKYFLTSSNIF